MTDTRNGKSNREIPPSVPSGFVKMKGNIVGGLVTLTAAYAAIYFGLKDKEFLKPDAEFCQDAAPGTVCSRSDLLAFQVASGIAISFCGVVGFNAWHVSRTAYTGLPQTPQGRLYGYLPDSELLAAVNFTFQIWDFFISLLIPEHQGPLMLMHHIAASTVCFLSLHYQVG